MKIPSRILLVVIVFLAAAAAHAQVIKGCVDKNGSLRVVLGTDACKNNESAISWNATGPQGAQGAQGITGRDGRDGLPGTNGKDGKDGKDGADGSAIPPLVTVGNATFDNTPAFEIKDFSFGVENPTTIGSATGGAGAGKIKFNEFTIKKTTDAASPVFFKNCASGHHYDKVTISMRKAGGVGDMTVNLGTVFLTAIRYVPATNPVDTLEEITMLAGQVQIINGAGSCWDQVQNRSCDGNPP